MTTSKSIGQAYTDAWLACNNPTLDSENPHFHNKFASLAATLCEVRKACAVEGIIYEQHELDGFLRSQVRRGDEVLELSKMRLFEREDPQKHGIQLTYKKRQMAQLDWGIVGEEDTDGEGEQTEVAMNRDYSAMTELAQEFADIMGVSVDEAKNSIVAIRGNPKTLTDKEYELYLSRVRADVSQARATKEAAKESAND